MLQTVCQCNAFSQVSATSMYLYRCKILLSHPGLWKSADEENIFLHCSAVPAVRLLPGLWSQLPCGGQMSRRPNSLWNLLLTIYSPCRSSDIQLLRSVAQHAGAGGPPAASPGQLLPALWWAAGWYILLPWGGASGGGGSLPGLVCSWGEWLRLPAAGEPEWRSSSWLPVQQRGEDQSRLPCERRRGVETERWESPIKLETLGQFNIILSFTISVHFLK